MNKRDYNVFFNTHTVSGIVISIGLYVIFLAGSFALFMENIDHWEINEPRSSNTLIDYDQVIQEVAAKGYNMHGRDFLIGGHNGKVTVTSRPVADTTAVASKLNILPPAVAKGPIKLEISAESHLIDKKENTNAPKAELGHFLFNLHYFNQIPKVGIFISGLVSIFFLFAIITGLIIHWDKIISHFFTFRLKSSLKNLWTNAHTTLGIIGLPYQLMYAITGTVFGLSVLLFFPYAKVLYGGNLQTALEEVFPSPGTQHFELKGYTDSSVSINNLVSQTIELLPKKAEKIISLSVKSYHDENAHLVVNIINDQKSSFFNTVEQVYSLADGHLIHEKQAKDLPQYAVGMVEFLHKIHFGNYGGYFLKIIYFLLALLTCLVIISGVMIWLKARDNKKYASQHQFNTNVGSIYLGACLGLYPSIALLFILTKVMPTTDHRFTIISWIFLAFWLSYTAYGYMSKNYFNINKNALILAGTFGILIPVCNGLNSGLWFWKSISLGYTDSFFVDISWLILGSLSLIIALNLKPKKLQPTSR